MFSRDFWASFTNHVAVNPHRSSDAKGLEEFIRQAGISGMCFFQTSGTDGRAKWVALPKEAFLVSAQAVNAHFAVSKADRWLVALPLHHVGGFAIHARAFVSGSTVIKDEFAWQPHCFLETCQKERITLVSLVPTQVFDLVRFKLVAPNALRAAIVGGGAISRALFEAAKALRWPLFQSYGMTEAASQIATQTYLQCQQEAELVELEVLPHWQVRVDFDGRLILRGASLARGFVHLGDGGWSWQPVQGELVTRDIVALREFSGKKFLKFIGRESGFVKILGELVHLAPLQAKMDALALAFGHNSPPIIVAEPDLRSESRLVLVTERDGGADLLQAFNQITDRFCQLKDLVQLPAIPRSPLGKVDNLALQASLSKFRDRRAD